MKPLACALLVAVLGGTPAAQLGECGDCDGSGALPATVLDALRAAQFAAAIFVAMPLDVCRCDVDGSGAVTVLDALRMAQDAAGLGGGFTCSAPLCGTPVVLLLACAMPASGSVPFGSAGSDLGQVSWNAHFEIAALPPGTSSITIAITSGTGDIDLHVGDVGTAAADPAAASYAFVSATPGSSLESVIIDGGTTPSLAAYAGMPIAVTLHAVVAGSFTIELTCSSMVALPPVFTALPAGPPARVFAAGVLDSNRERMLVFGGFDGGRRNDTWALDLLTDTWSQLSPSGSLPPGSDGLMAIFDPVGDRLITFGGSGASTSTYQLSFAAGANGTWSQMSPAGPTPPARIYGTAIYDPVGARMLIYGGGGSPLADLWQLSLGMGSETFTELVPAGGPTLALQDQTAVYDPARHRMILYAGYDLMVGAISRVFQVDLTTGPAGTWSEILPSPAGLIRWHHAAIFDPVGDRMLVHGGIEQSFSPPHHDDVAQLSFIPATPTWTDVSPVMRPVGRYGAVLVADLARRRAILYGGTMGSYGPGVLGDTWAMGF